MGILDDFGKDTNEVAFAPGDKVRYSDPVNGDIFDGWVVDVSQGQMTILDSVDFSEWYVSSIPGAEGTAMDGTTKIEMLSKQDNPGIVKAWFDGTLDLPEE
jgi:hypothetical protein